MDLAQILTGISEYAAGVGQQKEQVKVAQASNQDLAQQSIDAIGQIGDMKVQADRMNSEQALENENRKRAVASAFNVDMLDPENRIAALARQQAAEVDLALSQSRRASELNQMNIFDDPLSYMVQRPFAYRHAAEASAAAGRVQILDKAIDDLNTQAQQSVKTQQAINTEFTIDEAENNAKLVRMQADEAVRAAQMNKNITYSQDLKTLQGFDKAQLDSYIEGFKLKRHEQEFQANMEERRARTELMRKAKIRNLADFQMVRAKEPNFVRSIIEKGEEVAVQLESDGSIKVADGRIARTPGEVMAALSAVKGNFIPSAEKISATYIDQLTIAKQELRKQGLTKFTEEDLASQMNRQLMGYTDKSGKRQGLIQQMAANAEQDYGASKNIFRAPDITVVGTANPSITQSAEWVEIAEKASIVDKSPKGADMFRQTALAIKEGKTDLDKAAKFMSSYFGAAAVANVTNERPSRYAVPEDFYKKYMVNIPKVGLINAANEFEVKRALVMQRNAFFTPSHWR